jgi:hypothetical protein
VRKALLLLALIAGPALAAVQSATITRPAELRTTPFSDGKLVRTLPQGTGIEVVKRVGGWYEVKAPGANGWVRMWVLRFSTPASSATSAQQTAQVLRSGRSGATYTTATTGVRGLSEEDLAKAVPDPAAVQALESLAVGQSDARGFAHQASLKADPRALK